MSAIRWTLNDLKEGEAKGPRYGPISIGAQSRVSDNISTSNLTVPIVTFTAENTFTMDISATETYEVPFDRTNDMDDGNKVDGRTMNNAEWIAAMRKRVNQWQAHHDGYNLSCPGNQNIPAISQNGYIKSFSTTYKCGEPEHISGTLSFQSGSMRCKNEKVLSNDENGVTTRRGYGMGVDFLKSFIQVTSSDATNIYTIYCNIDNEKDPAKSGSYGCVSSYSLTYGPTDPFPCLKLVLSKKRLANIAPKLIDDFIPGKNRIILNACGTGTFIVTKCSMNSQRYTLTAYAIEEAYRGLLSDHEIKLQDTTPLSVITSILKTQYPVGQMTWLSYGSENIIVHCSINEWSSGSTAFPKGTSLWYILTVCAARMNCQIWFADGYAYICDLSHMISVPSEYMRRFNKTIYLNAVPNSPYIDGSEESKEAIAFCESVQDNPTLGDEGFDALTNSITVVKGTTQKSSLVTGRVSSSQSTYGVRAGNTYTIEELSDDDIEQVATNLAAHTSDVQQSITFTVTELGDEKDNDVVTTRWRSYFPLFTQVNEFVDHNTDVIIHNRSTWEPHDMLYDKLALSSVTRKFPEFSSEYTFGRIANTDLAQTTSVVQQAIGNK